MANKRSPFLWKGVIDALSPRIGPSTAKNSQKEVSDKELAHMASVQNSIVNANYIETIKSDIVRQYEVEASRESAMKDFETMEYFPMISKAMDIIAEEVVTPTGDFNSLKIHSDSPIIVKILEDLFYSRLNIAVNLYEWTRETIKYGDCFLLMSVDPDDGIIGCHKLINTNIERIERPNEERGRKEIWFTDKTQPKLTYNLAEVAHFRLLGDTNRSPYGTSMLEKSRKIHKMLVLAQDSMMVTRATRVERNLFHVEVGNTPEQDRKGYVAKIASAIKETLSIDNTGNFRHNFEMHSPTRDIFVPMVGGKETLKASPIAAGNINPAVDDIKMLEGQLLMSLGVPAPLLNYAESKDDAGNMASMDVRFAKNIMRVQQAMLMELNKIAFTHLYMNGYDQSDATNFRLELPNPSFVIQHKNVELLSARLDAYSKAIEVSEIHQQSAMSVSMAKKLIFGMSNDEITHELNVQFIERLISEDIKQYTTKITSAGIYDDLIKKFVGNSKINKDTFKTQNGTDDEAPEGDVETPSVSPDGGGSLADDVAADGAAPVPLGESLRRMLGVAESPKANPWFNIPTRLIKESVDTLKENMLKKSGQYMADMDITEASAELKEKVTQKRGKKRIL